MPVFFVEEAIYRRGPADAPANPFASLRLIDISVNRGGAPGVLPVLSEPRDVLLNFNPDNPAREVPGTIVTLHLKELDERGSYRSSFSYVKHGNGLTYSCRLVLKHVQIPCNYSHCAFEVYFTDAQGERVMTFENYKEGLNRHPKLQTSAKLALVAMMEREEMPVSMTQNAQGSISPPSVATSPEVSPSESASDAA